MKGKFITVEGSDGSGKTTFINSATEYLIKSIEKFFFWYYNTYKNKLKGT